MIQILSKEEFIISQKRRILNYVYILQLCIISMVCLVLVSTSRLTTSQLLNDAVAICHRRRYFSHICYGK